MKIVDSDAFLEMPMSTQSKCPKCGKNHIPAPQHVFKDDKGFYCSWTCFFHRNDGKQKKLTYKMVEVYRMAERIEKKLNGDGTRSYGRHGERSTKHYRRDGGEEGNR
jgi:hypothetical protein